MMSITRYCGVCRLKSTQLYAVQPQIGVILNTFRLGQPARHQCSLPAAL
ncbi:hypothetical protein NI392_11255 [Vibrio alginolyticus]|nr:hypothetical protein [Vibrio alginolyticus]WMN48704.1 hypothetical protein NI392_11255 [Vibrio alginolyticus]